MAYGDGIGLTFDEMDETELMFRVEDLIEEWHGALFGLNPDTDPPADLEHASRRLEDTALELALALKGQRLKREDATSRREAAV